MLEEYELELVGAIIGDGNIYVNNRYQHYIIGLTGHPKNDVGYFEKLVQMIALVWGKKARVKERAGGLRLNFSSKSVVKRLTDKFQLPSCNGKGEVVRIPEFVVNDWNLAKYVLRGIVDTDGSVFVADKPGCPNYPSIEISTASSFLAYQIFYLLKSQNFRVRIRNFKPGRYLRMYKVSLNGWNELSRWVNEIGFSNPAKLKIANTSLWCRTSRLNSLKKVSAPNLS